jgi:chemotaxis protein methyltransferase CheR
MSLSPESFAFIRAVLQEHAANQLEDDKVYLVETRLLSLALLHGFPSVEALVARLRRRRDDDLQKQVVEAMTINETTFFRDGYPFDVLRDRVIPDLIRLRGTERRLNIWSAACSSGQEVYSVAILLREAFPGLESWNVRLVGSDFSTAMLGRAQVGWFSPLEVSRGLPPDLLARYFRQQASGWQIKDDLRRMVDFRCINLGGLWPDWPPLDLVLLRNVLLYFDGPTRRRVLGRVASVLRPDGYLMLGGAETTDLLEDGFEPVTLGPATFFRLRGGRGR